MSALHQQLRAQWRAQQEFEEQAQELSKDMANVTPVRHLWVRVRLLELLVEQTGGNTLTEAYRVVLSDMKKRVSLRAESRRRKISTSSLRLEVSNG